MKPTNLYQSLFLFHKSHLILQELGAQLNTLDRSNSNLENKHLPITNYIVMETVSFIDEFEQNFFYRCETELKAKVILVKKITEPIFGRVKQWTNLKEFRNNIISHPWRDKNKNFAVPDFTKYNVPRNLFEHVVLVNLMRYVYEVIQSVFRSEFDPMFIYMQSLVPDEKEKSNYQELTNDHVRMAMEVNEIAEKEKYKYQMKVLAYVFD